MPGQSPALHGRHAFLGALLALAAAAAACGGNTQLTDSWRPDNVQPVSAAGRRIGAVFITENPVGRRAGEDALAQELARLGAVGVPSYKIVPDLDTHDPDRARKELSGANLDGVVIMRVLGATHELAYIPGYTTVPIYRSLWNYWTYGWGAVYGPGYLSAETSVRAETLVYSLQPDALLWAGTSATFDASSVPSAVRHIAHQVVDRMADQGVLVR